VHDDKRLLQITDALFDSLYEHCRRAALLES
jgi:hypothetical protein